MYEMLAESIFVEKRDFLFSLKINIRTQHIRIVIYDSPFFVAFVC